MIIGKWNIKYSRISNDDNFDIKYPYCDKDGNKLTRIAGKITGREQAYFVDDKGNKQEIAFRLVNGKPKEVKFSGKTKEVAIYKEVENTEVEDLNIMSEYLVDNKDLYDYLKSNNKALKFTAHFGTGEKALNYCYIVASDLYNGFCYMKCGKTFKSDVVADMVADRQDIKDKIEGLKTLTISLQQVNKALEGEIMAL